MDINDPFGLKRLQTMVERTQKAVNSVNAASAHLSQTLKETSDKKDDTNQPPAALSKLADTMKSASGQLDKIGEGIKKVDGQITEVAAKTKDFKI